jgi:hypothetical protein
MLETITLVCSSARGIVATMSFAGRSWSLLLIVTTACARAADEPPAPARPAPLLRITLERTPCFGWCPEYELSAAADGRVMFRGLRRWEGIERSWQIPADSLTALARQFAAADFFALGDVVPGVPACGSAATDHPSIVLTATDAAREHRVNYYTGCGGGAGSAPALLKALAGRVDSVTGAARLVDSLQAAGAGRPRSARTPPARRSRPSLSVRPGT